MANLRTWWLLEKDDRTPQWSGKDINTSNCITVECTYLSLHFQETLTKLEGYKRHSQCNCRWRKNLTTVDARQRHGLGVVTLPYWMKTCFEET